MPYDTEKTRAAVWGAICASTLACVWEPGADPPLLGYDPIPNRMEPRPFLDGWVVVLEALRLGAPMERCSQALSRDLSYGGLTEADSTGLAILIGLLYAGAPSLAARATGEPASLVGSLVAAMGSPLDRAIEDAGAGPEHLAARVALKLGEPTIGKGAVTEAASLIACTGGMDFDRAIAFSVSRGCRTPEVLAAVGAVAAGMYGLHASWTEPLGEQFVSGWGLRSPSPPGTVDELVAMLTDARQHASILG